MSKIIWLASYPKSGNTWFRIFLEALLSHAQDPVDINQLQFSSSASSRQLFDRVAGIYSTDLSQDQIDKLRPHIYEKLAHSSTCTLYLKIHDAYRMSHDHLPIIPISSSFAVLYFVRSPLDVAVSLSHHFHQDLDASIQMLSDPTYELSSLSDAHTTQLRQKILDWSGHVLSWNEQIDIPVKLIRYEDMLTDPVDTFAEATRFIGLDFTLDQIQTALALSEFQKLKEQEKQAGFRDKLPGVPFFFRQGQRGGWQECLSAEQVEQIRRTHQRVMERLGYLSSTGSRI